MQLNCVIAGLTSFGGHDTSACLMKNGILLAACEEERYTKEKHTRNFPKNAINDCLKIAKISINDIDEITLSYDPSLLKIENFQNIISTSRENFEISDFKKLKELRSQDFQLANFIKNELNFSGKITSHLHHLCHLASCYYPSGFEDALVISHDGVGEVDCSLMATASKGTISIFHHGNQWPNSLGLLYAAITDYLGWKYSSDEGIVMGLASYGDDTQIVKSIEKSYREIFKEIIVPDGFNYKIDRTWIAFHEVRSKWVSDKFVNTFGPKRNFNGLIEYHHHMMQDPLQYLHHYCTSNQDNQ